MTTSSESRPVDKAWIQAIHSSINKQDLILSIDTMSTQSSDSASASGLSMEGLARGLGIASIGSGIVLHELMGVSNSRSKCSADSLLVRHPLVFSDICDVSSKHLWPLHERLLTMLVALHKEEAPMEEHLVMAARLDTWVLIDLVLKERLKSRMAEPPSDAGFRFEGEPRDCFSHNHGHKMQVGVAQSQNSSILFSKDALQRSLRDTITLQKRRQAHFLQLAERNSETDSDLEIELPLARRLQILSRREDRRMARLIRDRPQQSKGIAESSSTDATAPMTDFVMSGALSPDPSDYLVKGNTSLINEQQINDVRAEQRKRSISKPLPPHPGQRTISSGNPEEDEGLNTTPKPPKRNTRTALRNLSNKIVLRSRDSFFFSSRRRRKRA